MEYSINAGKFFRLRLETGRFVRYTLFLTLFLTSCTVWAEATRSAPRCDLKYWNSVTQFDLHQLRGKVVYVDFWASWCTACVKSFPFMNTLDRELGDEGLVVLGVNLDERQEDAARFLAKNPVTFSIATDASMRCPKDFAVPGMPVAYLIDRKGNIRHEHLGFRSGNAKSLRALTEQLLSE